MSVFTLCAALFVVTLFAACANNAVSDLSGESGKDPAAARFRLGEINIICTDFERSLKFYRDILGFEMLAEDQQLGTYVHLRCGRYQFLLFACAKATAPRAAYATQSSFSVDLVTGDLKAEAARLKEAGVEMAQEWKPGAGMFVIRDPDGLAWEIIQGGK